MVDSIDQRGPVAESKPIYHSQRVPFKRILPLAVLKESNNEFAVHLLNLSSSQPTTTHPSRFRSISLPRESARYPFIHSHFTTRYGGITGASLHEIQLQ